MNEEDYLNQRVNKQIDWYDRKSISNQNYHKLLRITEIICAAIIPFISGFDEFFTHSNVLVGLFGIVIAVCAGISSLSNYQENWISYRGTCEMLKREKYRFLTKSNPYNTVNALDFFVQRIEDILSKEHIQWADNTKSEEVKKQE
ncbi:DUF4231 domain-containing protein [Vibrio algarum]|uniref:DUF4231 domain-containing protein n=1 Tax=Vibrio algarum TaxID=3020714 RepID=A0ABT4YT02_9VIBR|nr:DUF4231 domain-containing protein [Vibrio sp. KJ40-1]MDB1124691.1 DUF4231 domain-containing protein [Vibrio sp. KJ40-1]